MKVLGIDHVQLAMPVDREDEARAFYTGILGLRELPKPAALSKRGGAWFACGTLQLHLGVETDFRPAKKAHPALRIEDFDALITALQHAGYETKDDTSIPELRRAFTCDPFGNRIELIAGIGL